MRSAVVAILLVVAMCSAPALAKRKFVDACAEHSGGPKCLRYCMGCGYHDCKCEQETPDCQSAKSTLENAVRSGSVGVFKNGAPMSASDALDHVSGMGCGEAMDAAKRLLGWGAKPKSSADSDPSSGSGSENDGQDESSSAASTAVDATSLAKQAEKLAKAAADLAQILMGKGGAKPSTVHGGVDPVGQAVKNMQDSGLVGPVTNAVANAISGKIRSQVNDLLHGGAGGASTPGSSGTASSGSGAGRPTTPGYSPPSSSSTNAPPPSGALTPTVADAVAAAETVSPRSDAGGGGSSGGGLSAPGPDGGAPSTPKPEQQLLDEFGAWAQSLGQQSQQQLLDDFQAWTDSLAAKDGKKREQADRAIREGAELANSNPGQSLGVGDIGRLFNDGYDASDFTDAVFAASGKDAPSRNLEIGIADQLALAGNVATAIAPSILPSFKVQPDGSIGLLLGGPSEKAEYFAGNIVNWAAEGSDVSKAASGVVGKLSIAAGLLGVADQALHPISDERVAKVVNDWDEVRFSMALEQFETQHAIDQYKSAVAQRGESLSDPLHASNIRGLEVRLKALQNKQKIVDTYVGTWIRHWGWSPGPWPK